MPACLETRISCRKLSAVECYAWFTAACAIEEFRGSALENGFALTSDMEQRSEARKRIHSWKQCIIVKWIGSLYEDRPKIAWTITNSPAPIVAVANKDSTWLVVRT